MASTSELDRVTLIVMRFMRLPLIVLVMVYAVGIIGMALIPGHDEDGNVVYMSLFHAFYFFTYTATTTGFGEIPMKFSDEQRLWAIVCLFGGVIAWFYAIGSIIRVMQNPYFLQALAERRFVKAVNRIREPYILLCGFGDTGSLLARGLSDNLIRAVVIDIDVERIKALGLRDYKLFMPGLCADASVPRHLVDAGIKGAHCSAVVALCSDEDVNLKIAVMTRYLNPNALVICRSSSDRHRNDLRALGGVMVIDPFELFARQLSTAITHPVLYNLNEWLVRAKGAVLGDELDVPLGNWLICGYGRMGKWMDRYLTQHDIKTVVIDPELDDQSGDSRKIAAHANHETLQLAGIDGAAGIVACTNNDETNLNILLNANALKEGIFTIVRQNHHENQLVFDASNAALTMQSSLIAARRVLLLLLSDLSDILLEHLESDVGLTESVVSSLKSVVGDSNPTLWCLDVDRVSTPLLLEAIDSGAEARLTNLLVDPANSGHGLQCLPLVLKRGKEVHILPEPSIRVLDGDELLFCGTFESELKLEANLENPYTLHFVINGNDLPRGYFFNWLSGVMAK